MKSDNQMISRPIPSLIRSIAIPASLGFFFNTMYNVVDTFFAGMLGTDALAALSISFPIFFIILAMGSGLSTGATVLISNALGRGDKAAARTYALQAVSFALIISAVMTGAGRIFAPWLLGLLGAEGSYLDLALSYINIIVLGSVFFVVSNALNASLTAQGDTRSFRNVLIVGFFLNIILDPWFMFGGFGLPAMGIAGTAIATILIQFMGMVYIAGKVRGSSLYCKGCFRLALPRWKPYVEIAKQGFPASLNMMTVAIGIFVITYFLSGFGNAAVAAYGIATRIEQIFLLPTIGLNIAALTLIGQNLGAGRLKRVKEAYSISLKYGLSLMGIATVILLISRRYLMGFFTSDAEVVAIGSTYLIFASFMTVAYVVLFTSVSALQGMKMPGAPLVIGLARQIVAPIVVFSLIIPVFGILGVWWGILGIVWASSILTFLYTKNRIGSLR